jgi:hypothetical protein
MRVKRTQSPLAVDAEKTPPELLVAPSAVASEPMPWVAYCAVLSLLCAPLCSIAPAQRTPEPSHS